MSEVRPLKATVASGLMEFQPGDVLGVEHGGLGVSSTKSLTFSSLTLSGNLFVSGFITTSGMINGVDVAILSSNFEDHLTDYYNPHSVTPEQVGNTLPKWNASSFLSKGLSAGDNIYFSSTAGTTYINASAGKDLTYFRHKSDGVIDAVYLAGPIYAGALTTGTLLSGLTYALPFVIQKYNLLKQIMFKVTASGTGAAGRMAIYDTSSDDSIYPCNLIMETSSFDNDVTGMKIHDCSTSLIPNKLYWLCINTSSISSATYRAITISTSTPILGVDSSMNNFNYGLKVTQTFGSYPSTFPVGAAVINSAPIPALGMVYS